jgi:prepilin peptidase CpaA
MSSILKAVLIALVVAAATYDFRFRRIPNWLNLSGIILGLGLNTLLFAQHGFFASLLGVFLAAALYVPLYLLRAMGGGDVKLMSAVAAITGPKRWIFVLACTAIAGGLLAIVVTVRKRRLRQTLWNVAIVANDLTHFRSPAISHEALDVRSSRSITLPHAVAIAAGTLAFIVLNPS